MDAEAVMVDIKRITARNISCKNHGIETTQGLSGERTKYTTKTSAVRK